VRSAIASSVATRGPLRRSSSRVRSIAAIWRRATGGMLMARSADSASSSDLRIHHPA
jgi:hypothetical protein